MLHYKPNELSPKTQFRLGLTLCIICPIAGALVYLGNGDLGEAGSSIILVAAGVYMVRKGSQRLREERERAETKGTDGPDVGPLGL